MKKLTISLFVGALLLLMVGGYLYLDSKKEADKEATDAKAAPVKVIYISTKGVIKSIETKLGRQGRAVDAKCPKKYDGTIGTRFTCDVFFVGGKEPVATANVRITGLGGQYKWTSKPIPRDTATPTSTPTP